MLSERRTAAERRDDEALVQDVQKKSGELSARLAALKLPEPPPLDAAIAGALGPKDALVNFVLITRRQGTRSSDAAIEDQRLLAVVRRHDQPPQLLDLGSFPDIVARLKVGQEGTDTAKEMYAALFGKLSGALGGVSVCSSFRMPSFMASPSQRCGMAKGAFSINCTRCAC